MRNGHLKYSASPELINSLITPDTRFLPGQYVPHVKRSLVERAYEAADLHTGRAVLVRPTVVLAAQIWRINTTYVHHALRRPNDRMLVESGVVPLVPPAVKALPAPAHPSAMAEALVGMVGLDRAFDELVAAASGH